MRLGFGWAAGAWAGRRLRPAAARLITVRLQRKKTMASTGNTNHERALLECLQHAVHGLRAPFTCGGTLVPEPPVTLCFRDETQIPMLRARDTFEQERLLRPLVERCAVAGFGMGRKTRYDPTV